MPQAYKILRWLRTKFTTNNLRPWDHTYKCLMRRTPSTGRRKASSRASRTPSFINQELCSFSLSAFVSVSRHWPKLLLTFTYWHFCASFRGTSKRRPAACTSLETKSHNWKSTRQSSSPAFKLQRPQHDANGSGVQPVALSQRSYFKWSNSTSLIEIVAALVNRLPAIIPKCKRAYYQPDSGWPTAEEACE